MKARVTKGLWHKKNYLTWHEFWYPGQAAALKAEQEYNERVFWYNNLQDELEAKTSLDLTKIDNIKMIAVLVIAVIGILLIRKYS